MSSNKRYALGFDTANYVIRTYGVDVAQEQCQSLNQTDPVDQYTIGYHNAINIYFSNNPQG